MNLLAQFPWPQIDFVKVGLSDLSLDQWPLEQRLKSLVAFFSHVPDTVSRVLVIYADVFDVDQANALLDASIKTADLNPKVLLLDTFDKTRGTIFEHYSPIQCRHLFSAARKHKLKTVLAGSIDFPILEMAAETGADLIGVRGAVCALSLESAGISSTSAATNRKNAICAQRMHNFLTAATPPSTEATQRTNLTGRCGTGK